MDTYSNGECSTGAKWAMVPIKTGDRGFMESRYELTRMREEKEKLLSNLNDIELDRDRSPRSLSGSNHFSRQPLG